MKQKQRKGQVLVIFFFLLQGLSAQVSDPLEQYIRIGLESNLSLKQKAAGYEKSIMVLREARSYFYPHFSLFARYTVADGGRKIDFPVGDLLNPVYSTLNSLTGSFSFPEIDNQSFRFLRPREHETKIQVVHPLINTDIYFNEKIKSGLVRVEKADLESYQRLLVYQITTSYLNVLKTWELIKLYQEIRSLALENLRVNEKLYGNDMITKSRVERSNAELAKIDQQLAVAEKDHKIASAYLNFLINRPLMEEIFILGQKDRIIPGETLMHDMASENALSRREEMTKLEILGDVSESIVRMHEMRNFPEIIFAVDYGFQGTKYRFTGEDDFILASIVLRWDLFQGFQNRQRTKQARLDASVIRWKQEETRELIRLEVTNAWYSLEASRRGLEAAEREFEANQSAFREVNSQYNIGLTSMLEYLDARTSLSAAGTARIAARYEYLSQIAEFERSACLFPIDDYIQPIIIK